MLIHLNLENTSKLESLQGISKLSSLRTILLENSKTKLYLSLMKELELLEHLECITIWISSSLVEEQLLYDYKVWRCIQEFYTTDLLDESVKILVLPASMVNVRVVNINKCRELMEIKLEKTSWNKSLSTPSFFNLLDVRVFECDGLKDLTWLLFIPNLKFVYVGQSDQVEAIINKEKAEEETSSTFVPFRKLQSLQLYNLPQLKSIYWTSLLFPCLAELQVINCPNLRKLPLDSKSVPKIEEFRIQYNNDQEWIESVMWEDVATKYRFEQTFRPEWKYYDM